MENDLLTALDQLGHPGVLVLGDLILDRYIWGNAERVSQEAPVILLRTDHCEDRLGGAANVANLLVGLEAQVTCAGLIGADADGQALAQALAAAGVNAQGLFVDPARPTTVKQRFIGRAADRHPHQILRVDSEVRDPLPRYLEHALGDWLHDAIGRHAVLLISDYAKGVCTPELLRRAITRARQLGVPVLVDPVRGPGYERYRGATAITPNRVEAETATGVRIAGPSEAYQAGRRLCAQAELDYAVVTLDRDGMALVEPSGNGQTFPTRARAVYDITGAGDMVLAMIGLAWAARLSPHLACQLANVAAGLEVERVGVAIVTRDEVRAQLWADRLPGAAKLLSLENLVRLAEQWRAQGRRVVFTNGCFDLLHVGHVSYLQEARALGDVLIVGVNSDSSVRRLKGPSRPVISQSDRGAMLAALACVDAVVVFEEDTPHALLRKLRPDVLVKGGTYTTDEVVGHEIVTSYGGQVRVTGAIDGISTSQIVASVAQRLAPPAPHFAVTSDHAGNSVPASTPRATRIHPGS